MRRSRSYRRVRAIARLAQQPLESLGTERRDGDRLQEPQPLGRRLGLRARRLRADELLAVALGAAALAEILDMEDEVRRRALARRGLRRAHEHRDRRAGGPRQAAFDLVARDDARGEVAPLVLVDAVVRARTELVERAAHEILRRAAHGL